MKPRFEIGETVYIKAGDNGKIHKRKVVSVSEPKDKGTGFGNKKSFYAKDHFEYELDKPVEITPFHHTGVEPEQAESVNILMAKAKEDLHFTPAPEFILMKIGDLIYDTHPFWRGITDKILMQNDIKP